MSSAQCVLVRRAQVLPIEAVVRGYLAGSAWASYQENQSICGVILPSDLREAEELPEAIFTPSTKAQTGHDENIDFDTMARVIENWLRENRLENQFRAADIAEDVRDKSIRLYKAAQRRARVRGIIIADTKLEFGICDGQLTLVDELLTPDSSRFWDASGYNPGRSQSSFDKQYLRDWLVASGWNREPPPPSLPDEVVENTRQRYIEAYERLIGRRWPPDF